MAHMKERRDVPVTSSKQGDRGGRAVCRIPGLGVAQVQRTCLGAPLLSQIIQGRLHRGGLVDAAVGRKPREEHRSCGESLP